MPTNSKQLIAKKVFKHTQEERGGRREGEREGRTKWGRWAERKGHSESEWQMEGGFFYISPLLLQVGSGH